ncbi:hypothetical protein [Sporosarcina sp. FSL K6-3457]
MTLFLVSPFQSSELIRYPFFSMVGALVFPADFYK